MKSIIFFLLYNYIARGNGCTARRDDCVSLRLACAASELNTAVFKYPATAEDDSEFAFFLHPQELRGNADKNTVFWQELDPPIVAHFLRIYPLEYRGWPSLRLELYGCAAGQ